jgi:hypothetical protein
MIHLLEIGVAVAMHPADIRVHQVLLFDQTLTRTPSVSLVRTFQHAEITPRLPCRIENLDNHQFLICFSSFLEPVTECKLKELFHLRLTEEWYFDLNRIDVLLLPTAAKS